MKRGKRAGCRVNLSSQLDKLTSLSGGTCHRKWNLSHVKKMTDACQKKLRIASASEKVFARLFGHFLVCSSLSKTSVCGWTRCEIVFADGHDVKYDCDITPHPHLFHGTKSYEHSAHRDIRVNKTWKSRGRSTQLMVTSMSRLTYCLQSIAENPPTPQ